MGQLEIKIENIQQPRQLEEFFEFQPNEQSISEIYDMLISQGLDSNILNSAIERMKGA